MTSIWGTLSSNDLTQASRPNNANSNDCWCRLSATNNQRIVLSVISFQFEHDQSCTRSGLYLQSNQSRSLECTQLQKGHYYISSSQDLFVNFYTKRENRIGRAPKPGSFWIVYECKLDD